MQSLRLQPDKLHISDAGTARVRRNLKMPDTDLVQWCKETVQQADLIITQGKYCYVYRQGVVITVRLPAKTIITAHPLRAKVRPMQTTVIRCVELCARG